MKKTIFALSAIALLGACSEKPGSPATPVDATDPGTTLVVASNYPVYYFASRIVDGVPGAPDIVLPEIEGDPAIWIPDAAQVELLQSADRILLNGAGAESWLDLISIDQGLLFDTTGDARDRLLPLSGAVQHQHGPEGEHSHEGFAFTTWLDPDLAAEQAGAIAAMLAGLTPAAGDQISANLQRLTGELEVLDKELEAAFATPGEQPVLFSHPVYQYLEQRYRINGMSLHWEPDVEPSTRDWIDLQQMLAKHPARVMIWEAEPLPGTRTRLEEMNIQVTVFAPAAGRPDDGDYLDVMRANVKTVRGVLQQTPE